MRTTDEVETSKGGDVQGEAIPDHLEYPKTTSDKCRADSRRM